MNKKASFIIPTIIIKEAARGDQLLKAILKKFSPADSINPTTRYNALAAMSKQFGQTPEDVLGALSRSTDRTQTPGDYLKLLTGKSTKTTNPEYVVDRLRRAGFSSDLPVGDPNSFMESARDIIAKNVGKRKDEMLYRLSDKDIMTRL